MMYRLQKWISPVILAVICQQAIRLVTDISIDNTFWVTPSQHLRELIISPPFFYLIDRGLYLLFVKRSTNKKGWKDIVKEYGLAAIYFSICIIITVFIIHVLLSLPDYFRDYVIAVMVCVPILLFYFTLIRNEYNRRKVDEQNFELERVKAAQLETEMKFLKAQYHPHFLFNALNTIYFLVDETNMAAKEGIELLSGLLRYRLYDAEEQVPLEDELQFLNTYIAFQKLRIEEGVKVDFSTEITDNQRKIHPLLFHPLLENAFKYVNGNFYIGIRVSQQGNMVIFKITNTIIRYPESEQKAGIGLTNLKQRLAILYPGRHDLSINKEQDLFTATLTIEME